MSNKLTRRQMLAGTAATGATLAASGLLSGPASAAVPGFPSFTYEGMPLDIDNLSYNPTGEIIFPCIRSALRYSNRLAHWYMYYAPHDIPGGICLAFSESLTGPFTEYPGNPIISRDWSPHYSVDHVSSPHAIYDDNDRMHLFFHGKNDTTRWAWSDDGINFTYGGVAVDATMLPSCCTASYARVHKLAIDGKNNTYTMLFVGDHSGTLKIWLAWSDSLEGPWTVQQTPLLSPPPGISNIASPHYWPRNGGGHVVYHGDGIRVAYVGPAFDQEDHLGVLHAPMSGPPDNGRVAAPAFAFFSDRIHMFYTAGQRGSTTIARATAWL